jgi:hypothetical protein
LQGELRNLTAKDEVAEKSIREKNDKIRRLSVELANWQSRVPPLVERYRTRDEEARELEGELEDARADRRVSNVYLRPVCLFCRALRAARDDRHQDAAWPFRLGAARDRVGLDRAGNGGEGSWPEASTR